MVALRFPRLEILCDPERALRKHQKNQVNRQLQRLPPGFSHGNSTRGLPRVYTHGLRHWPQSVTASTKLALVLISSGIRSGLPEKNRQWRSRRASRAASSGEKSWFLPNREPKR